MLCGHCGKNQATKSYELMKRGKKEVRYYCLDCYHKIFLSLDNEEGELLECPYCGATFAEIKRRNLVGCAHCYTAMKQALLPAIEKMQGVAQRHVGKSPYDSDEEKTAKRVAELDKLAEKYNDEKDYESARECEEISARLDKGFKEEYVWRNRPHSSKQS